MVATNSPALIRKIYEPRGTAYVKSKWFHNFRLGAGRENLFSELDPEKHDQMRQQLAPGVSIISDGLSRYLIAA